VHKPTQMHREQGKASLAETIYSLCAHTRLQWTVDALHVRDQELSLRRLSFLPTTKPGEGVKAEEAKP